LAVTILLLIGNIILSISNKNTTLEKNITETKSSVDSLAKDFGRIETSIKSDFKDNRDEISNSSKANREELALSIKSLGESLSKNQTESFAQQKLLLDTFSSKLDTLTKSNNDRFDNFIKTLELKLTESKDSITNNNKESRKELKEAFESLKTETQNTLNNYKDSQKESFEQFQKHQTTQFVVSSEKLVDMKNTIEKSIKGLQEGNEKKLEEMRITVDEKLQKTLETRLGESFKQVSERLEAVHKGLGDMQQLATGVGDLKKVLSNVKTRGMIGEYQLENILEQMLTPDQYGKNVKTKEGSNALVEFAIKLPGQDKEHPEKPLWIPIDAKFPREDFEILQEAYDKGDIELIENTRKNFSKGIRKFAIDISTKYIDPPNTTDFAILFLPFESLYAEALRIPGLFESIQREFKVIMTGPTTLSAILTSLQMGFRTLSIEKKSSEVWDVLGVIKREFNQFGVLINKTQKKIQEASNVIQQVKRRNSVISKSLRSVEELPHEKTLEVLGLTSAEYEANEAEIGEEEEDQNSPS
jgi:DNA recombination protein RmuC